MPFTVVKQRYVPPAWGPLIMLRHDFLSVQSYGFESEIC